MKLQLKPRRQFAPGGFAFVDPRTGVQFSGYELGIEGQVSKIIEHRQRNPKIYPPGEAQWFDREHVMQEVLRPLYLHRPDMFVGTDDFGKPLPNHELPSKEPQQVYGCVCGSKDYTPTYCPTCSGQRINGYRCTKCGVIRYRI